MGACAWARPWNRCPRGNDGGVRITLRAPSPSRRKSLTGYRTAIREGRRTRRSRSTLRACRSRSPGWSRFARSDSNRTDRTRTPNSRIPGPLDPAQVENGDVRPVLDPIRVDVEERPARARDQVPTGPAIRASGHLPPAAGDLLPHLRGDRGCRCPFYAETEALSNPTPSPTQRSINWSRSARSKRHGMSEAERFRPTFRSTRCCKVAGHIAGLGIYVTARAARATEPEMEAQDAA